jgi:hypothetical protein
MKCGMSLVVLLTCLNAYGCVNSETSEDPGDAATEASGQPPATQCVCVYHNNCNVDAGQPCSQSMACSAGDVWCEAGVWKEAFVCRCSEAGVVECYSPTCPGQ